jgi:RES domain-containing protein
VIAYRLAEARHARTAQDALSGEGAFLFGGRWNPPGYRVAYAAERLSLAVLEILVHTQDRKKLEDYRLVTVNVPDELVATLDKGALADDWQADLTVTRGLGKAWLDAGSHVALLVPSVIIAGERNLLVNPLHPDFARLEFSEPRPFRFDSRLLG